jgi:hypothetical protein
MSKLVLYRTWGGHRGYLATPIFLHISCVKLSWILSSLGGDTLRSRNERAHNVLQPWCNHVSTNEANKMEIRDSLTPPLRVNASQVSHIKFSACKSEKRAMTLRRSRLVVCQRTLKQASTELSDQRLSGEHDLDGKHRLHPKRLH